MSQIDFSHRFVEERFRINAGEFYGPARKALKAISDKTCKGSEWTGWYQYPEQRGFAEISNIKEKFANSPIDYDSVVVVGIGGSYLGTRAVENTLRNKSHKPIYYFGHHLSSRAIERTLGELEGKKPLICMISKSGTTTEPGLSFRILRDWLQQKMPDEVDQRIVAITDPEKGALRQLAEDKGWVTFPIPSDVGGRFSVLTSVGIVPLYLAGFDVDGLMEGADEEFKAIAASIDSEETVHSALDYAANRFALWNEGKRVEILSIIDPDLHYICEWWKQLFGESEGKHHKGLFPASLTFTTDLHSLGQYAQDGFRSLIETFLTFKTDMNASLKVPVSDSNLDGLDYLKDTSIDEVNEAAMKATLLAHSDGEVPCMELRFPSLNARSLGSLFAFFETSCAVSALLLGVNPFDQPGVEDYKNNLFALMGRPGFEEQQGSIKARLDI